MEGAPGDGGSGDGPGDRSSELRISGRERAICGRGEGRTRPVAKQGHLQVWAGSAEADALSHRQGPDTEPATPRIPRTHTRAGFRGSEAKIVTL